MAEHSRSGGSHSSKKRRRVGLVVGLALLAIALVALGVGTLAGTVRRARSRSAIRAGKVTLEGVKMSWDLERSSFTATLYLLNHSASTIEGELEIQFSPDPDKLSSGYLEALAKREAPRGEWERLVANLEGRPRLAPKERALLRYLKRGMRTDFPTYETLLYDGGERPTQLAFCRTTASVLLPPQELARVAVAQDMPESRLGEEIGVKNVRILDIEF